MFEVFMGIAAGVLTVLLNELRRRRKPKHSTHPPPPTLEECKRCFFYREVEKRLNRSDMSDTQVIRILRDRG